MESIQYGIDIVFGLSSLSFLNIGNPSHGSTNITYYDDFVNDNIFDTVEEVLETSPSLLKYLAGDRNQEVMDMMEQAFEMEVKNPYLV